MRANSYHQDRAEVPQPPSECPQHQTWSPLDDAYLADPYPIAAALRAEHPVFYAPSLAKFETQTVTEILAQRLPSLRLMEGQRLDYFPNITFRGPTQLNVAWI